VRAHETLRDGEPDARAAGRARPRRVVAPEEVEHAPSGELRDAVAGVVDRDEHAAVVRLRENGDRAAVGRVAHRVREQVKQHALDLLGRHANRNVRRLRLEPDLACVRLGAQRSHRARDQLFERAVPQLERYGACVEQRHLEEIVDERREDPQLFADCRHVFVRRREAVLDRLDHCAERRERSPEVVTGPGDELAPGVEELLDVGGHLVEGVAELDQLAGARLGRARTQVAGGELRRSLPEALERAEDAARQQHRAGEADERGRDRDGRDLRLVVHAEHHPAGREHDRERQADRREHERGELHAERRQSSHTRSL
jgi:hypothetical protein